MMVHPLSAILFALAIVPMAANAEMPLDGLKDGAAKATKAVGDATKGAVHAADKTTDAVKLTVESIEKSLRDAASRQETREELDAMAEATLGRLFAEEAGSHALVDLSAG